MQDKQKLVVVGNGTAGIRAVEELLKLAPDLYDITVIGAEPHVNYNRILLSPVLTGEQTLDDIILNREDWYASNGIRLLLGRKVTGLNWRGASRSSTMAPRCRMTACCWRPDRIRSCCRCRDASWTAWSRSAISATST